MDNKIYELVKHSEKVVGLRQVLKGIINDTLRCVVVADDCDGFITDNVGESARERKIPLYVGGSMSELGIMCGIDVGAAVIGIKKS